VDSSSELCCLSAVELIQVSIPLIKWPLWKEERTIAEVDRARNRRNSMKEERGL